MPDKPKRYLIINEFVIELSGPADREITVMLTKFEGTALRKLCICLIMLNLYTL